MDDLILYGCIAVAVLYLTIFLLVAGAVYGMYLIFIALLAGRFDLIINAGLITGALVLVYGIIGFSLAKQGII